MNRLDIALRVGQNGLYSLDRDLMDIWKDPNELLFYANALPNLDPQFSIRKPIEVSARLFRLARNAIVAGML